MKIHNTITKSLSALAIALILTNTDTIVSAECHADETRVEGKVIDLQVDHSYSKTELYGLGVGKLSQYLGTRGQVVRPKVDPYFIKQADGSFKLALLKEQRGGFISQTSPTAVAHENIYLADKVFHFADNKFWVYTFPNNIAVSAYSTRNDPSYICVSGSHIIHD